MINVLLYQTVAFTIYGKNIKKPYKNDKFKISAPTWSEKSELPHGSYSVSDIRYHFEYIIKKQIVADNTSIMIYVNKI